MKDFESQIQIGPDTLPVKDYELDIEDIDLAKFNSVLDNDFKNDTPKAQQAKEKFKEEVKKGIETTYLNQEPVYLSSLVNGMHQLAKAIDERQVKLAVCIGKYASALIANEDEKTLFSAKRFSEQTLWQAVFDSLKSLPD